MSRETNITFMNLIGIRSLAAISVGNAGTIKYTITTGTGVLFFQNSGTKTVWFGDGNTDGDNKRGLYILPNQSFQVERPQKEFILEFICAGSDTSTVSIGEGIQR